MFFFFSDLGFLGGNGITYVGTFTESLTKTNLSNYSSSFLLADFIYLIIFKSLAYWLAKCISINGILPFFISFFEFDYYFSISFFLIFGPYLDKDDEWALKPLLIFIFLLFKG